MVRKLVILFPNGIFFEEFEIWLWLWGN